MICCYYKDCYYQQPYPSLNQYQISFDFDHHAIIFIYHQLTNDYSVDFDPVFKLIQSNIIAHGSMMIFEYNQDKIVFYFIDDSYVTGKTCIYELGLRSITIGTNGCDIEINLPWITSTILRIDPSEHSFVAHYGLYDGKTLVKQGLIKNGLPYTLFGFVIALYNNQLIISETTLIHVNLKPTQPLLLDNQKLTFPHATYIHHPLLVKEFESHTITIPHIFQQKPYVSIPILVTMGPMLIMGLATLASGGLLAYQRYMKGQDFMESLPSLLLPIVLILSTLIFQPLNRFFEKRRTTKENEQKNRLFEQQMSQLFEQGKSIYSKYGIYLSTKYPLTSTLMDSISAQKTHIYSNNTEELSINMGQGLVTVPIKFEGIQQYLEDNQIYQRLITYQESISLIFAHIPLSLKANHYYLLVDSNRQLYKHILIQLMSRYSHTQLKFIFIVDPSFLSTHQELFVCPYCYSNQWLVVNNISDIEPIHLESIDKAIIFTTKLMVEGVNDYPIIYLENAQLNMDTIIRLNDDTHGVIESIDRQLQFEIELLEEVDLYQYCISNYNYLNNQRITYNLFSANCYSELNENLLKQRYVENEYNPYLDTSFAISESGLISLDISEKGEGPHGVVSGATGFGKSELILSLVLGLVLNHSPSKLNLLVVDFKGSALASSLKKLPHFVGSIDNLTLLDLKRFIGALKHQLTSRQHDFLSLSQRIDKPINDLDQYRQLALNYDFPMYAHLLVIIDEFAEVKKQVPEFVDEVISIARIGRSLGIHLLLSTQKASGMLNDQIWSNIGYKICLKVNDTSESLEMIGSSKATTLRNVGQFYIKNVTSLRLGQCLYAKAYYDHNHENAYGSIIDITNNEYKNYQHIKVNTTYYDTIVEQLTKLNFNTKPLLNEKVSVQDYDPKNSSHLNALGIYDDIDSAIQCGYRLKAHFKSVLAIGTPEFTLNILNAIMTSFSISCTNDMYQTIVYSKHHYPFASLTIDDFDHRFAYDAFESMIYNTSSKYIVIIDHCDQLNDDNSRLLSYITKIKQCTHIVTIVLAHKVSPLMLRKCDNFDHTLIESTCSDHIKSLFFNSLKKVEPSVPLYYYVPGIDALIASINYKTCTATFASCNLYDSTENFQMNKDCFAKYVLTGQTINDIPLIITAFNDGFLNQQYLQLKALGYNVIYNQLPSQNEIACIELKQFQINEQWKYLYYNLPIIYLGPAVKQQYVFPLQSYDEHSFDYGYYLYQHHVKEIRWANL